jgi:hypothetical protein
MIAHVAQAGEQRGRVVLWLDSAGEPQETAVDAALCLAQAFDSEMESLFIEDRQLFDLADLPFAREISLSGRKSRTLSAHRLEREMRTLASALQRRVLARARAAEVKAEARVVREEPVRALAKACAENGPWNVVTIGAPLRRGGPQSLEEIFGAVDATTGIVVAGPEARRTSGSAIAIVEDLERAVPMLRATERIASATGGEAQLWLVEYDRNQLDWMEGQMRLLLASHAHITLRAIDLESNGPLQVAQMLRREGAGFVIAQFGGRMAPTEADVAPLTEILEGPLFLVR